MVDKLAEAISKAETSARKWQDPLAVVLGRCDRAQVALRRSRDRGFGVAQDIRLPPAAVDLIERQWFDSFDDSAYCRGSKRNEIWITSHEADVSAILHHGNNVACQQRAFAPAAAGRRWPVQHCATFEMSAAIDQREPIPERQGCSFPKVDARTFSHDPLSIFCMQKYLRVKMVGPFDH